MIGNVNKMGFTLVELLVVLAVIAVLFSIVMPLVGKSIPRAKEAALRENLTVIRKTIDDYYADKGQYPKALNQLEDERYIRKIPLDPITGESWEIIYNDSKEQRIVDIRSRSKNISSDGTIYENW